MAYPFSGRLNRLLGAREWKPDAEILLHDLRNGAAQEFGENRQCALALMNGADGMMQYGRLTLYLVKLVQHDSAVRDVITVGHLAKLLGRIDLLKQKLDYRTLAWPNPLFDSQSQKERDDYFSQNDGLPTSATLLEDPLLNELRARERATLIRFGIIKGHLPPSGNG